MPKNTLRVRKYCFAIMRSAAKVGFIHSLLYRESVRSTRLFFIGNFVLYKANVSGDRTAAEWSCVENQIYSMKKYCNRGGESRGVCCWIKNCIFLEKAEKSLHTIKIVIK